MTDKYLCIMASLAVVCYVTYILAHVIAGSLVPDGILLSGVIASLGLFAGVKIGTMRAESKALSALAEQSTEDRV